MNRHKRRRLLKKLIAEQKKDMYSRHVYPEHIGKYRAVATDPAIIATMRIKKGLPNPA